MTGMPALLHLDSSISGAASRTRVITAAFADRWRGLGESFTVVHRDIGADPVPHLPDRSLALASLTVHAGLRLWH